MKMNIMIIAMFLSIAAFANANDCIDRAREAYSQKLQNDGNASVNIISFKPLARDEVTQLLGDNGFSGKDLKRTLKIIDQHAGLMFEADTEQNGGFQKEIIFTYSLRRNCELKSTSLIITQD